MAVRQVRVGVLADSMTQPAWVRHMLERIIEEGNASFEVVVLNSGSQKAEGPPAGIVDRLRRYWRARARLLFIAFNRLDRWKFRASPDAFEMVDVTDLLGEVRTIEVTPRRTKFSDFIEGDDLERVRAAGVDLFIRLGFRILRGGLLTSAPLGVWSFHHGDNRVNRGGPAGYWEVLLGWPTTGTALQILNEDLDAGLVLSRSWSATHALSPNLNRNNFYWKSAAMLPRKLAELSRTEPEAFLESHQRLQDPVSPYSNRLFTDPKTGELFGLLLRWLGRYLRRGLVSKFFREQWQLRFSFQDTYLGAAWRYKKLVPPKDRFWADPHLIERDGVHYAFIEEKPNAAPGHISVMEVNTDGSHTAPQAVLREPFHLSYPFLFEWDGALYMMPESGDQRQVRLYRCVRFPDQWAFDRLLMDDVHAVDATLFEHEGRWWMFVTVAEHAGASTHDELFLFSASSPLSTDWRPHPLNPIVSDVRRARPAGPLIVQEGRIIRPAQDCSRCYGYALRLMEVVELSEECYAERELGCLTPDFEKGLLGTHSLSVAGRLNMIDVKIARRRWG